MDLIKKVLRTMPDFTSHYASQEFSRKICEWNVYYVKTVKVPPPVSNFLNKNRILAGGAVLDLLEKNEPNDYDIFFINKMPSVFLDGIKKNKYFESINCITIKNSGSDVQFIKRLYENENRVIGGFDLDACRFYMNHRGEVYGTATAILSLRGRKILINPCCQSENFTFRIMKYSYYKNFKIIHPHYVFNKALFEGTYDYDANRFCIEEHVDKTVILILANKAHKCSIKNKPYSFELLSEVMLDIDDVRGKKLICYYIPELRGKGLNLSELTKEMLIDILREKYQDYLKITNFIITNTSSQMTASFHPTNYRMSEIYPKIKFDILKDHLRVIFEIIRFGKMPRIIYYKIFRDYYDSFLLMQERVLKQN